MNDGRRTLSRGALLLASASLALMPLPAMAQTSLTLGAAATDVGNLDPHFSTSTSDRILAAWIFGGLVRFKPGTTDPAQIEPDLAESWESSDDGLVWTFNLREGVQWHGDYGEVTAEDVVFSLEKAADPERSAFSSEYEAFESVDALDPRTVRITLSNPVPNMLGLVSNYAGGFLVPQAAYEELGERFGRSPIGFGPFELESITPGLSANFVANEDYFRGAPQLETVTYRFLDNNAARDLAFFAGEVDAATGLADQRWLERTSQQPNVVVDAFDPAELTALHVNVTRAPFDDIRVRQALAHAIDAQSLADYRGPTFTIVAESAIPSNNLGFVEAGVLDHAPERARALLAEAGYPDGLTVEMIASQLPSLESTAQILQGQLEEAGFTLNLQPVEHATWHQMIRQDLSPLVLYGAARFPVADYFLTQFYDSASAIGEPGQVTNFSHCSVADEPIRAARVETDEARQLELWEEAQRLIVEEVCVVPIVETRQVWARNEALDWGFELQGSLSLGPLVTEQTHFTDSE